MQIFSNKASASPVAEQTAGGEAANDSNVRPFPLSKTQPADPVVARANATLERIKHLLKSRDPRDYLELVQRVKELGGIVQSNAMKRRFSPAAQMGEEGQAAVVDEHHPDLERMEHQLHALHGEVPHAGNVRTDQYHHPHQHDGFTAMVKQQGYYPHPLHEAHSHVKALLEAASNDELHQQQVNGH